MSKIEHCSHIADTDSDFKPVAAHPCITPAGLVHNDELHMLEQDRRGQTEPSPQPGLHAPRHILTAESGISNGICVGRGRQEARGGPCIPLGGRSGSSCRRPAQQRRRRAGPGSPTVRQCRQRISFAKPRLARKLAAVWLRTEKRRSEFRLEHHLAHVETRWRSRPATRAWSTSLAWCTCTGTCPRTAPRSPAGPTSRQLLRYATSDLTWPSPHASPWFGCCISIRSSSTAHFCGPAIFCLGTSSGGGAARGSASGAGHTSRPGGRRLLRFPRRLPARGAFCCAPCLSARQRFWPSLFVAADVAHSSAVRRFWCVPRIRHPCSKSLRAQHPALLITCPLAGQVREMRLVRREDARGVCLVLLRFCDAETAAGFYDNYNGRPVSLPYALKHLVSGQKICAEGESGPQSFDCCVRPEHK